ncbi:MAG: hypothetical protein IKC14_01230, partial [Kiritimatiellae bacterium]|nr:hypothetical protein [Kiritimatiellia bacterium]
YLGLWDTVDSTVGLDVAADCPRNVKKARHAVSRDETRRFFQYVPQAQTLLTYFVEDAGSLCLRGLGVGTAFFTDIFES